MTVNKSNFVDSVRRRIESYDPALVRIGHHVGLFTVPAAVYLVLFLRPIISGIFWGTALAVGFGLVEYAALRLFRRNPRRRT